MFNVLSELLMIYQCFQFYTIFICAYIDMYLNLYLYIVVVVHFLFVQGEGYHPSSQLYKGGVALW